MTMPPDVCGAAGAAGRPGGRRSAELHVYQPGGGVTDPLHRDAGSLLTISMLLTLSLLETETASVYLLYLLAPLWAALFGRFFLREPIRRCAFGLSTCLLLRQ